MSYTSAIGPKTDQDAQARRPNEKGLTGVGMAAPDRADAGRAQDRALFETLNGIPAVDFPSNLQAALAAGRRMPAILREVVSLRRGRGKLTPNEYFYYRLWNSELTKEERGRFIGKIAQHPMHVAAGAREWFAASADKILFHSIMDGVGLRTPELVAITQAGRYLPNAPTIADEADLAEKLRDPSLYPLFAKQVAGKYSLSVLSADGFDPYTNEVLLLDGTRRKVSDIAASLVGGAGYLIQRRLPAAPALAARFGQRLWSARLLVLVTPSGPVIHRAVAKIATGTNSADNYWRPGNRLGAIDLASGRITRVVSGAGADLMVDAPHPDTGAPIVGTTVPGSQALTDMVRTASHVFAGIRTQSWDIALTADGPVFLELNYGGDLNLHQLAHGAGVLDETYREHLRRCGYRGKL